MASLVNRKNHVKIFDRFINCDVAFQNHLYMQLCSLSVFNLICILFYFIYLLFFCLAGSIGYTSLVSYSSAFKHTL